MLDALTVKSLSSCENTPAASSGHEYAAHSSTLPGKPSSVVGAGGWLCAAGGRRTCFHKSSGVVQAARWGGRVGGPSALPQALRLGEPSEIQAGGAAWSHGPRTL